MRLRAATRALRVTSLAALLAAAAAAQPAPADTLTEAAGWHTDAVLALNLAQAAYSGWQEGGVNTLAATAQTTAQFARVRGEVRQVHDARLAYGIVQQDTLAVRKATDILRYAFRLQYTGFGAWRPTFATELRTQFAPGYDYNPSAQRYPELAPFIVPGQRLKVSDLFAPAFWTQSVGVAYDPSAWFHARVGVGLKEAIVHIPRLRPVYGNAPDQPWRVEAGMDALVEAWGEPFENVRVRSRMSLFQAFTSFAEAAPDLMWENTAQVRLNRWLQVSVEATALYDSDVSARIQLKETLAVGIAFTLL
jgi:hypothetical protein